MNNEALLSNAYNQAHKQASLAKPWVLKHGGKIYTGVFNHKEWVYDVFEDGFFMMKINIKQSSKAKAFLSKYLVS